MSLTAPVIIENMAFNQAGPKSVTKQHFCEIF